MSLQDIYYLTAIILNSVGILLLLSIIILLFVLKNTITDLQRTIHEKLNVVTKIANDPGTFAAGVGSALASQTIKKVKKIFNKEKE